VGETQAARPGTPFAAVLFDCDGVLVDSETITIRVLAAMLRELGWEISEEETVRTFIGRVLQDEWEVILQHTGIRITDAWIHEFHVRRDDALRVSVQPIPGAHEMLAQIAERWGDRIALASGADRVKLEMQLGVTDIGRWFGDRVFSGMEQPRSKPAPDVYLAAARALGIHRHTLRNRITAIERLLGIDLDDVSARTELWLALAFVR